MNNYPISEIFGFTIQGEGIQSGMPTAFVRFAGCNLRCDFCDTRYAQDSKDAPRLDANAILQALLSKGARCGDWVTLTGGEPALFVDSGLCKLLGASGLLLAMETAGSVCLKEGVSERIGSLVVSPKPPSAGTTHEYVSTPMVRSILKLRHREQVTTLKYVIFDGADYEWVKEFDSQFVFSQIRRYLSVGTPLKASDGCPTSTQDVLDSYRGLVETVVKDPEMRHFVVLPQMHVLLWGQKRGI